MIDLIEGDVVIDLLGTFNWTSKHDGQLKSLRLKLIHTLNSCKRSALTFTNLELSLSARKSWLIELTRNLRSGNTMLILIILGLKPLGNQMNMKFSTFSAMLASGEWVKKTLNSF